MSVALGLDIGSSSVKASLFSPDSGVRHHSQSPLSEELPISSSQSEFAEQEPSLWWEHVKLALRELKSKAPKEYAAVSSIGVAYQMHGLVCLGEDGRSLRPAIIWCDSRATAVGEQILSQQGRDRCLAELRNEPGNFTVSKLLWVKQNQPEVFEQIATVCLPGDYICFRLTGERQTTATGLSEAMLWNYEKAAPATELLESLGIPPELLPEVVENFEPQAKINDAVADELGLTPGVVVSYRAGDQPNNAFSLRVFESGSVATTAGTSGVVYAVTEEPLLDTEQMTNTFLHLKPDAFGSLFCLNGCGILYAWLRRLLRLEGYEQLNALAAAAPVGAGGLQCFPYGNGAERSLGNEMIGASFEGIDLLRHEAPSVARAAIEGIAFALHGGLQRMVALGLEVKVLRAGDANLFQSETFCQTLSSLASCPIETYKTDGAEGAARAAALGVGMFSSADEAFASLESTNRYEPKGDESAKLQAAYDVWADALVTKLNGRKPHGK